MELRECFCLHDRGKLVSRSTEHRHRSLSRYWDVQIDDADDDDSPETSESESEAGDKYSVVDDRDVLDREAELANDHMYGEEELKNEPAPDPELEPAMAVDDHELKADPLEAAAARLLDEDLRPEEGLVNDAFATVLQQMQRAAALIAVTPATSEEDLNLVVKLHVLRILNRKMESGRLVF